MHSWPDPPDGAAGRAGVTGQPAGEDESQINGIYTGFLVRSHELRDRFNKD